MADTGIAAIPPTLKSVGVLRADLEMMEVESCWVTSSLSASTPPFPDASMDSWFVYGVVDDDVDGVMDLVEYMLEFNRRDVFGMCWRDCLETKDDACPGVPNAVVVSTLEDAARRKARRVV